MATDLIHIKTTDGGGVANIDMDNVFSDKFDVYELHVSQVNLGSIVNAFINFRLLKASDGTADTTANYDSSAYIGYSFTAGGTQNYTNQSSWINTNGILNSGDYNNGGIWRIFNPFNSDRYTFYNGQTSAFYFQAGIGGRFNHYKSQGCHTVEQSNSGISVMITDIVEATVSVYGVQ